MSDDTDTHAGIGSGMRRPYRDVLTLSLCALHTVSAQTQTRHDVLRGRVTTDTGRTPVPRAIVSVTRAPDRAFKQATSGNDGSWAIDWPDGTGDYLVHVGAEGYEPFRRRVTRTAAETVFVVNAVLAHAGAAQLAAVMVQARRQRPDREAVQGASVGATEMQLYAGPQGPLGTQLPPDLSGDLSAAASLVPGVTAVPGGGISVLGLGPAQNSVTLNGMSFAGGQVPRDVSIFVRTSTSIYDPASGWFSGARTNVQLAPGGLFAEGNARLTVDPPQLQYVDPLGRRLGQRFTGLSAGTAGDGQLVADKYGYSYGIQASRRDAATASLLTADPFVLQHAGVSADSATRLVQLAQASGAPLVGLRGLGDVVSDNVVFLGRLDHAPYDWSTLTASKTTWGVTGYASHSRAQPLGLVPTAAPGHTMENASTIGAVQADYSTYFGHDYLADFRSGLTVSNTNVTPQLSLPEARVLVSSQFPDATPGTSQLFYGGNAGTAGSTRQTTWESMGEIQLYPPGFALHRVRLTAHSRLDAYRQDAVSNAFGTYTFNSLADVAANQPASFSRTLNTPPTTVGAWNGAASIADLWRVSSRVQVLYGARVDGDVYTQRPAYNPTVENAFGVRTDHAPNGAAVSPRLGFDWSLPRLFGVNGAIVRGGAGLFRNLSNPNLLANPSAATGLPTGQTRFSCVGSDVPAINWAAFEQDTANIPRSCLGSTPAFADSARAVQLIGPSFAPSESWRGNLAWQSRLLGFPYTIEAVYSLNVSQPGIMDLNFNNTPRFTLSDEQRPVYVPTTNIVSSTGAASLAGARRSPAFGPVVESVSDLKSVSRQATLSTTVPIIHFPGGSLIGAWRVAYTLANTRAQQRGFDGAGFGDPTQPEWARGNFDVRHQITSNLTFLPGHGFPAIVMQWRVQSPMPFTPLVRGDVNGDGLASDRAFVFDPATAADTSLASGMRSLIAGSSPNVRKCLLDQLGRAAGRNSCDGPWTATMHAAVIFGRTNGFIWRRTELVLNLTNPLSGIDQLVHGSNNLHGWGAPAAPDPVLYTVTGFDPSTNRFRYQVNSRFGNTSPAYTTLRAPFRVTLDLRIDLAAPQTEQQMDRWLRPGRAGHLGTKATVQDLVRRLERNVPDPYADVMQHSDSLLLTPDQVNAIRTNATRYRQRMDSLWTPLATYLAALPDEYDAKSVYLRADSVVDDAWELTRLDVQAHIPEILTPIQLPLLGGLSGVLLNAPTRMHRRIFVP